MLSPNQPSDTGACRELAADLRVPVLLADAVLHRRVTVHYLTIPDVRAASIHQTLLGALREAQLAGHPIVALIDDPAAKHPECILTIRPYTPPEHDHG